MTLPNAILVEKNKLSQGGSWVWLVALTPAGRTTTYRYTNDTLAVSYGGVTYDPLPLRVQPMEKSIDGSLAVFQVIVTDVGLALQSILRANNGLRNASITLTQVATSLLAQDFSGDSVTFQVSHCQNQYCDVILYCGVPGSVKQRVPEDQYLALTCRHDFRVPVCSFQNQVAHSQAFAGWTTYGSVTVTDNTADLLAPDGTQTASKWILPGGGTRGKYTGGRHIAGRSYTVSVWLRGAAGGEAVAVSICDAHGVTKTLTTSWVRYTYTTTNRSTTQLSRIMQITSGQAVTIYVWGAQCVEGPEAGLYCQTAGTAKYTVQGAYSSRCGYAGKTITAVTLSGTNPVQITATAHGFVTGDLVRIYGIGGATPIVPALDADYTITRTDADQFTLDGTDSSDYTGTYTSGGKAGYAKCSRLLTQCRINGRSANYGGIAASRPDAIRLAL